MRMLFFFFVFASAFTFGASEDFLKIKESKSEEASAVAGVTTTDVSDEDLSFGLEAGEKDTDLNDDGDLQASCYRYLEVYHSDQWWRSHPSFHHADWYSSHGIYHNPMWFYHMGIYARPYPY